MCSYKRSIELSCYYYLTTIPRPEEDPGEGIIFFDYKQITTFVLENDSSYIDFEAS